MCGTSSVRHPLRSDYRLFHNHHTIEPLLEIFGHGTPPFERLTTEFRRRVVEEAVEHGLSLIFTFVWGVDDPAEADLAWSDAHVREVEGRHRMNTDPVEPTLADELLADHEHLRLDNAGLTPDEAAQRVLGWLAPH